MHADDLQISLSVSIPNLQNDKSIAMYKDRCILISIVVRKNPNILCVLNCEIFIITNIVPLSCLVCCKEKFGVLKKKVNNGNR